MTAPRRSGADQAVMRGIIVIFVAVVIGLALLSKSTSLVGSTEAGSSKPTTTSTTATPSTTPGTASPVNTGETPAEGVHAPAQVKIVVVNAAGKAGVGSKNKGILTTAGYNVVDVKDGRPIQATTTVYYTPGYQADAATVKAAIQVSAAKIALLPASPIVPEAANANITVVFGQDYQI